MAEASADASNDVTDPVAEAWLLPMGGAGKARPARNGECPL
jgi:hypothetical protein